ncbi:MAG: MBL fold metallo-hydrolase [Mycobacteriales bacterium]
MRILSFGHAALLVDTGTERILVDPWLTPRLDRFWERWPALPAGLESELSGDIDAVVLSHHHYDHHHFPSLAGLATGQEADFDEAVARREDIRVLYPRPPAVPPRFTASGLGHQAIAWTLRRLGFTNARGVTPGETVCVGETLIRTLPSRVPFPEMSILIQTRDATVMLCGDSLLHPDVVDLFADPASPRVDVAFVPTHSVSPTGVLTERRQVRGADEVVDRATAAFLQWCETLSPAAVVPSSFGWRVASDDPQQYAWANRTIFPLTVVQAAEAWRKQGGTALLCGAGQVLDVAAGQAAVSAGDHLAVDHDFDELCAEVTFRPETPVPPLDPQSDRVGRLRESPEVLAERLCEHLVGTDFWYRAAESGQTHALAIAAEDGDHVRILDLAAQRTFPAPPGARGSGGGFTRIAGSTLQALEDADLLFGSSYGLWVSDDNLLSAVFHHPRYYVRHVEKAMRGEVAA